MIKFIIIIIIIIVFINFIIIDKINYWKLIWNNRYKKDYIKWILSDKYYSKKFAQSIGFNVAKTYFLILRL